MPPISAFCPRFRPLLALFGLFFVNAAFGDAVSEGQRRADQGNGTYLNPILSGDRPDPSILKDGTDYYLTHSSFTAYPGLLIWHSRDLVNWEPVVYALHKNVGSVWAPDLVKHKGRYFIYFPAKPEDGKSTNFVVWADRIEGPWSEPIEIPVSQIDPGHAVGADGRRYLFLSGGMRVALSDDGLSLAGAPEKVYDGWQYPEDWDVEAFSQEGPKLLRHGDFYYMVLAEGGTAGPPTSHMVVVARSRSIDGPWENSPYNPVVRTRSRSEKWWSRGHASLVEAPDGRWYMIYHGYENGFWTLGRQTLMEPLEWTSDGWFRALGGDLSKPLPAPTGGTAVPNGIALSDEFASKQLGLQWSFSAGDENDLKRVRLEPGQLVLKTEGVSPKDSSPLAFVCGDQAYEVQVQVDVDPGATAGLVLFYSPALYAGFGFSDSQFVVHRRGTERYSEKDRQLGNHLWLRLRNNRHTVSMHYSPDGKTWERFPMGIEVSGFNHNVGYGFLSLRPAIYASGKGEVRFSHFVYKALSLSDTLPLEEALSWTPAIHASLLQAEPRYLGAPTLMQDEKQGPVICYDGVKDGLQLDCNPLQGLKSFTVEALIRPSKGGALEQRLFHIADSKERRVLLETRLDPVLGWSLDTHLYENKTQRKTLLDLKRRHSADSWHWVALVYDGNTMRSFVDGEQEGEIDIKFGPMDAGQLSLGVRLNRVSWYKGAVKEVIFHPGALTAAELKKGLR
jgi:beta-xylosidase